MWNWNWGSVLFLYCPEQIDESKKKKQESLCLRALPGVPWLLFLSYCNTTPEVHFALWYTVEIHPSCVTDCLLGARCFKKIKEGSSYKEKCTAECYWVGNTWTEGVLWLLTLWIWCSYETRVCYWTEPNAAFKTRNLSPFPTAIFEVASAQYITALIGLADLRIIFACFGTGRHFF